MDPGIATNVVRMSLAIALVLGFPVMSYPATELLDRCFVGNIVYDAKCREIDGDAGGTEAEHENESESEHERRSEGFCGSLGRRYRNWLLAGGVETSHSRRVLGVEMGMTSFLFYFYRLID